MMSGAGPAGGALSRRQTSKGPLTEPTLPLPSRATPRELLKVCHSVLLTFEFFNIFSLITLNLQNFIIQHVTLITLIGSLIFN